MLWQPAAAPRQTVPGHIFSAYLKGLTFQARYAGTRSLACAGPALTAYRYFPAHYTPPSGYTAGTRSPYAFCGRQPSAHPGILTGPSLQKIHSLWWASPARLRHTAVWISRNRSCQLQNRTVLLQKISLSHSGHLLSQKMIRKFSIYFRLLRLYPSHSLLIKIGVP